MNYVPVLGVAPSASVVIPVSHYFDDYLVSIAEPTTSRGWTLQDIFKQMKKIERVRLPNMKLYLDSGGYQIITGHIVERRIKEYTDVYHFILRQFHKNIDVIFSLDINTPKFSQDKLIKYNDYSISESIKLHKEFPDLKDKQLFVVQSRFPNILEDWLTLMDRHKVGESFTRYSFGGLVGLKGEIKSHFNHFVPMTIWLITYLKSKGLPAPKQIHMLGQSSRLAIITGIILERLFGTEITMDSSEIIRFRPISAKVPMLVKGEGYSVVNNVDDMQAMIQAHSDPKAHSEIENMKANILKGNVTNQTFVELISQNLNNLIEFGNKLTDDVLVEDIINWSKEDFENYHQVFRMGRLSTEMANNMRLIRIMRPYYEKNNFDGVHKHTKKIISNYYSGNHIKTGEV